jgi:hypothetical protein
MKWLVLILSVILVVVASPFAVSKEKPIQLGTFSLKGTNPDGIKKYDGVVVIQKQGENYRLTWLIGVEQRQAQTGVAIYDKGILSVGYLDASGMDVGVVSFKVVNAKKLVGKWSSVGSRGEQGEEILDYMNDKVPEIINVPKEKKEGQAL